MKKQCILFQVVLLTSLFLICISVQRVAGREYSDLTVEMDTSPHGIYDPSLEYDTHGTGWMSYSSINLPRVDTHLAKTTDFGATWHHVRLLNQSAEGDINFKGTIIPGIWRSEVSTLVHDPDDPGREWKIFYHKYFNKPPYEPVDRVFPYGWIGYKFSSSPGGPWSEEIALFGAGDFPPEPYKTKIDVTKLDAALHGYLVFTEPAALYKDGVLYLALEGSRSVFAMGEWQSRKVFLLASRDHGVTWKYVGILFDYEDSSRLGYTVLTGASLFSVGKQTFIMTSPSGSLTKEYKDVDGVYIFEFTNLSSARLKRETNNDLIPYAYIKPSEIADGHGGQADYDEQNTAGGVVMGHVMKPNLLKALLTQETVRPFHIFNTYEKIPPEQTLILKSIRRN